MSEDEIKDIEAGDAFRKHMVPLADSQDASGAPLWYGWVIMTAYLAGLRAGREEKCSAKT